MLVATKPVDFRKGPQGVVALVRDAGTDPFSGTLYVFRSKRADRVKIVWWDGTGVCLFAKRLGEDRFRWRRIVDRVIRLRGAHLRR
jgi:transposase